MKKNGYQNVGVSRSTIVTAHFHRSVFVGSEKMFVVS